MTAKISILLPTYNGSTFVAAQIHSILAQTHGDFELLIADDGSTDDTRDLVDRAARSDNRIKVLPYDGQNRGQKLRLLELVAASSADLIAFSDQDDVWEAPKLFELARGIRDVGLAFGPSELVDAAGQSVGLTLHEAAGISIRPQNRLQSLRQPLVSAHAMLIRRALLSEVAFCRRLPFDWALTLDAQFSSTIAFIGTAVTKHRIHETNQTNGMVLIPPPTRRLDSLRLPRAVLPSGTLDRISFLSRISHLSTSPVVSSETRRRFSRLYQLCEAFWLVNSRNFFVDRDRETCRRQMREELRPLAGSTEDWEDCEGLIRWLTSSWRQRSSRYVAR